MFCSIKQIKDMFKYVFRNVKEPQIRTIRYITEKLKRRNSMLVRPVSPGVNFNYRLYVDKMFDQKLRAIISYLSITDVGSTEYHLKTPTYLVVVITPFFPNLSINC